MQLFGILEYITLINDFQLDLIHGIFNAASLNQASSSSMPGTASL